MVNTSLIQITGMLAMLTFLIAPGSEAAAQAPSQPRKESGHNHNQDATPARKAEKSGAHHHEHKAPHGGTLIALGEHFAHVELVIDKDSGKVTAYVLDGEAENAVRIAQETLIFDASLKNKDGASTETITLKAVASPLTGESVGDTSQFEATAETLKGAPKFAAMLHTITLKGKTLKQVAFRFPEGNEE